MNKKQLTDLAKVVVSLGLIALLLNEVGFQQTVDVFRRANIWFLVAALGLYLSSIVVKTFRWQLLLDSLGIHISVRELLGLNFIGFLFNNILPSGIGGDVVKMYELCKNSRRGAESVNAVFVDRVVGLIVGQALAVVAAAIGYRLVSTEVLLITIALFVLSIAGMWLLLQTQWWERILARLTFLRTWQGGKWEERIRRLYTALRMYSREAVLKALTVSILFNFMLVGANYCIGRALGVGLPIWHYLIYVPITSIVTMIPLSLNGLGVREMGYVALFTQAGVAQQVAFSMSLTIYSFTVISGLIGGMIYLLRGTRSYLVKEASR